jgi:RimJ/RimL family protein N-acetyltransferase
VNIALVAPTSDDAARWHRWRHEAASLRFNPLDPLSVEVLRLRLHVNSTDLRDRDALEHRWFVQVDGEPVGYAGVHNISWRNRHAEIGYQISEAFQGRGYGTAAVRLLVERVFADSPIERLMALIHHENVASMRLVERLGFRREGLLRKHFVVQGQLVDEALYGLLRADWVGSQGGA